MNRTDWQQLAETRISEAIALMSSSPQFCDGAYYLAGYAVECGLKACIAKLNREHDWPEKKFVDQCHTHNISLLDRFANLVPDRDANALADPAFGLNRSVVEEWTEQARYKRHSPVRATRLIEAVHHQTSGVLPWIKVHW